MRTRQLGLPAVKHGTSVNCTAGVWTAQGYVQIWPSRVQYFALNNNPAMSEVIALQPAAIVDHVALLNDDSISTFVGAAELGGSRRVDTTELKALLSSVPGDVHELVTGQQAQLLLTEHTLLMLSLLIEFNTKAGGSAANVARSLAGAFGVAAGLVSQALFAYLESG